MTSLKAKLAAAKSKAPMSPPMSDPPSPKSRSDEKETFADDDDDDEFMWKSAHSKRATKPKSARSTPLALSDDDEHDGAADSVNDDQADPTAEDDDTDDDKDEWRHANCRANKRLLSDPTYRTQLANWNKFRRDFPIPLKPTSILSTGATFALRKQLSANKKLIRLGIPVQYRRNVWELLAGARTLPERLEHHDRFAQYLAQKPTTAIAKQIALDVTRALRGHLKYNTKTGQSELNQVLSAYAIRTPAVGYSNAMCHVTAFLLLFYPPSRAFYMLIALTDIILPKDYYTHSLLGVRADCQLLKILVFQRIPKLHAHLLKFHLDVSVTALKWLMPLFTITLPIHVVIRVWDCMMLESGTFLLSVAMALFYLHQRKICALNDEFAIVDYLNHIGLDEASIDTDEILRLAVSSKCAISKDDIERRDIERRIMENEYMKELQITQRYRKQEEERRKREAAEQLKEENEQEQNLAYGTTMYKIGRSGAAKRTKVCLLNESPNEEDKTKRDYVVTWESSKKPQSECRLMLRECSLKLGQSAGVWLKRADMCRQFAGSKAQCFSFQHPVRSLDLVCDSAYDFDDWMKVLYRLPMNKRDNRADKKAPTTNDAAADVDAPVIKGSSLSALSKSKSSARADSGKLDGDDEKQKARGGGKGKLAEILKNSRRSGAVSDDEGSGGRGGSKSRSHNSEDSPKVRRRGR